MSFNNLQRRLLVAALASVISLTAFGKPKSCAELILECAFECPSSNELTAPIPWVLSNLGLEDWTPEAWQWVSHVSSRPQIALIQNIGVNEAEDLILGDSYPEPGMKLLSLGEGYGALIPFGTDNLLNIAAIDPLYHNPIEAQSHYQRQYYHQTVGGYSTDLSRFANESQDMVVSHDLFQELEWNDRVKTIAESYRVARVGSTVRHSYPLENGRRTVDSIRKEMESLLRQALPNIEYRAAVFVDNPRMTMDKNPGHGVDAYELVDTTVLGDLSYQDVRRAASPLQKERLRVLIVLEKMTESPLPPPPSEAAPEVPLESTWYDWLPGWWMLGYGPSNPSAPPE